MCCGGGGEDGITGCSGDDVREAVHGWVEPELCVYFSDAMNKTYCC